MKQEYLIKHKRRKIRGVKKQIGKLEINNEMVDSGPTISIIGEGNGILLQCSCLEYPMDRGAWEAAVHRVAKSRTTERLHFCFSLSCIGEGNGNPLQCSSLENPRDGGAWWAAVSGRTELDTTETT